MNSVRSVFVGLLLGCAILSPGLAWADPPPAELLKLHTAEAQAYQIFRDEGQTQPLTLNTNPVFSWTNLARDHIQYGNLFVWSFGGRPEVIATFFSSRAPSPGRRNLTHEFHTLSTHKVFPVTPDTSQYQWTPARGITPEIVESPSNVAESPSERRKQMRDLARSFSAKSRAQNGDTWDLRLLPTPLSQYEPSTGEVLQGALFAMVSSAGTDPEVLLLIEARHPPQNEKTWAWYVAALRFSDMDLTIERNKKPFWSSLDDKERRAEIKNNYTLIETPDRTYMCYRARIIEEIPDEAP